MAAILATVDVEDLATPKVAGIKDALSDLTTHVETFGRTMAGMSGSLQAGADALGASAQQSRAAAQGFQQVQASVNSLAPQVSALNDGIVALITSQANHAAAMAASAEAVQLYAGGLAALLTAAQNGASSLQVQARALKDLADAAQAGNGFTKEHAATLRELQAQVEQNIPLTQEQIAQLSELTQEYANANREALGLGSATEQLLDIQGQQATTAQQAAQGMQVLTDQMQEGTQATALQKAAFEEISKAAQQMAHISEADKKAFETLNREIQQGGTVSKETAAEMQRLNGVMQGQQKEVQGLTVQMAALAAALGVLFGWVTGFLKESVDLSARVETLGVVMATTAKNANMSTIALQTQVEGIKRLGVTTVEATETVLQFVQAQLDVAKSSQLARVAQDLAVVAGIDSSQALDRLLRAINTQQPEMLRSFGLLVSMDTVMRKFAQSTNQTVSQLDPLERKTALLNYVLAEGARAAGSYEASMATAGKMVGSMVRLVADLKERIGDQLLPAWTLLVKGVFEFLTVAAKLPDWFYTVATAVMVAVAAIIAFNAILLLKTIPAIIQLGVTLKAMAASLLTPWGLVVIAVAAVTAAIYSLWRASQVNTQQVAEQAAATQATIDKMEDQRKKIIELEKAQDEGKASVEEVNAAYVALGKTAPLAVQMIKGEWVLLNAEVDLQKGKLREQIAMNADTLEREAKRRRDEANTNQKAYDDAYAAAKASRERIAALEKPGGPVLPLGVREEALRLDRELEVAVSDALKTLSTSQAVATALERQALGVRALVDTTAARTQAAANAQEAWNDAVKQFNNNADRLKAQLKSLGTSYEELFNKNTTAARLAEIQKLIAKAIENLAELDKKSAEHEQKRTAARIAELERLRGTSAAAEGQLDALEQMLGKVTIGSAEWFELMALGNNSIEFFNKHVNELANSAKLTAASAQAVKDIRFGEEVAKWKKEMDATIRSFDKFSQDTLKDLRKEMAAVAQTDVFANERAQLQFVEDLVAAESELQAARDDRYLSDKDKALAAEKRRMDALERAFALEHRLRELAFMEEEAQLYQKFELIKAEHQARVKAIQEERFLKLQADREELERAYARTSDAAAKADLERQIVAADKQYEIGQRVLGQRETQFEQEVDLLYASAVKQLEIRRHLAAETESIHRATLDKQHEISKINIQKIMEEYDTFLQFGKALLGDLLKASTQTFLAMLSGAEKWSDGFKSILRGLRDAFFSLVDSMIKKWIDEFLKNVLLKQTEKTAQQAAAIVTDTMGIVAEEAAKKGGASTAAAGMSKFGAYSTMAVMGGFTGYATGSQMSSRTKGALVGAGTGAVTGAMTGATIGMLGGPIGVAAGAVAGLIIGGIAGAIGGAVGGGKEKREVQDARKELLLQQGGYAALQQKVQRLGYDITKLSQATTKATYEAELRKIEMLEQYGGMEALKKVAAMAGYTAKNIDDTFKLTGEYFDKMMGVINGEITKLQIRLEGFRTAAGGLQIRTEGFADAIQSDLQRVWDSVGPDVQKKLEEAYKKAQEKGFSGTNLDFMLQQLQNVAQGAFDRFGFGTAQIAEFNKGLVTAQEEFNRLGLYATATFAGILQSTGDINQAMNSVGDSLDKMIEQQDKLHLQASASISQLLEFRRVVKANEDVSKSLTGITQILKGLSDAGALTQELFSTLGADISSQWDRLQSRGVDAKLSMLMLQPALQKLWEAQKKYGYTVDANTQKLLAQAQAQGLVGEKFKETNEKILDVLLAIADALNAKIPEGLRTTAAVAASTLPDVEAGVNAVTYGHSPGGIEDIVKYLGMATEALKTLHGTSEGTLADTTENADKAAAAIAGMIDPMAAMQAYAGSLTGAGNVSALGGALSSPLSGFLRQRHVAPPEPPVLITAPMPDEDAETTAPDGTSQPSIVINMPITIDASALDGQDMVRVWHDQIVPQLQTDLERNAGQLASFVESRISRYRK